MRSHKILCTKKDGVFNQIACDGWKESREGYLMHTTLNSFKDMGLMIKTT
jgi:hypothetical protein